MIPRLLHQTWATADVPPRFADLAASWRRNHPDWDYRLWTDADNRAFVAEHFPGFLAHYDTYPHPIQRVDAARYLILLKLGGVFVDLDFQALRPVDPILTGDSVFGLEPEENCATHGRSMIVSNAFMASRPGHPFLHRVAEDLARQRADTFDGNLRVLETTGPFFLTRTYQGFEAPDTVTLLPAELLFPLGITEIEALQRSGWTPDLMRPLRRAYAVHFHAGTWWR